MDRKASKAPSAAPASSSATSSSKPPKRLQASAGTSRNVSIGSATEKVWLVKVPKYLAQQWLSAQYDNEAVIAKLTRLTDAQGKNRFRLRPVPAPTSSRLAAITSSVSLMKKEPALKPGGVDVFDREYEFLINPVKERDHSMVILCEGNLPITQSASVAPSTSSSSSATEQKPTARGPTAQLLGMVSARVDCRACQVDQLYMKRMREEFASANKPKGEIKLIDDCKPTFKPVSDHEHNIKYKQKKKAEGKNIRRDEDEVKSDLFRAFERHQYYKISDLVDLTKQPPPYLKRILEDIADYNVKPPYKNMWELKPQYRHYLAQQPNDAS